MWFSYSASLTVLYEHRHNESYRSYDKNSSVSILNINLKKKSSFGSLFPASENNDKELYDEKYRNDIFQRTKFSVSVGNKPMKV